MASETILWAATDIEIRPTRCYPVGSSRVVVEGGVIRLRSSGCDPLLFRDLAEADSFIRTVSSQPAA